MKLAYKAYDSSGQVVAGHIETEDMMTASEKLRQEGLFATELTDAGAPAKRLNKSRRIRGRTSLSRTLREVAVFTRQLCVLLSSGTPLVETLGALERQVKPGLWRDAITGVRTQVKQGASLSEAMEAYPQYFDAVYCSLVAAGESGGCLNEMLNRLATLKQKELGLRNSILGAMIYPSLLIVLALVMLIIMLVFIVPKFTLLFSSLDVPLPPSTQILVTVSVLFKRFWWAVFLGVGLLIFGTVRYLRTDQGRLTYDALILKLPLVGNMVKSFTTARIVRVLGVLMAGHVSVLKALHLVKEATGNCQYRNLITRAEECVTRGEAISMAFANPHLISPSVHEAIRSGEQSGKIDQLLLNVAEFLEDENEVIVRSLTSIIEPVILVGMGILIGLIAISMFMPLFDLTALTQGGG